MTDWPVKTLGEVCDLVGGGTPSKDRPEFYGGEIPWATVRDLNVEVLRSTEHSITVEAVNSSSSNIIPSGSVVIATRVGLGKAVIVAQDTAINQDLRGLVVKKPKELMAEYLYWWYLSTVHLVVAAGTGATVQGVKLPFVSGLAIPVPPLEEQKRIVELLDNATARVAELTACYEQARTHANNLFTSALRDALESNPDWPIRSLGEVCDFVRGVTYDKADARSEMKSGFIPLLRATNITEKGLLRDDFVFVPKNGVRADQKLISGDALITIASGSASVVGRSVLVEDPGEMTFGAFCGVLRPRPEILPRYLSHFMSSRSVRAAWSEAAQGTNINNLKRDDILQTECLLPPLEEQKRIVARLDSMKAKTSEMVAAYDAKLTVAKNLRQSILESAFAGDL